MNQKVFIQHRDRFLKAMKENSFAILFSGVAPHKTNDQSYPYTPNRNFFYLTGLKRENFVLLLVKGKTRQEAFLFIEEASDYATKWLGRRLTKDEASEISGITVDHIRFVEDFPAFVSSAVLSGSRRAIVDKPDTLYLDLYRFKPFLKPVALDSAAFILNNYPEIKVQMANEIIDAQRVIKDEEEIAEIRKAIEAARQGIEAVMKFATPGINEHQIEAYYEYQSKMAGSDNPSFASIIASGKNGCVLHYEDNNQVVQDGTLVLMDLGALSNLYAADISRTFPISGVFSTRQKQIYDIVLRANKLTMEKAKPGVFIHELNQYTRSILAQGLKQIGLIKEDAELDRYYYHTVSHYLGIDVHDVGTYQIPLQKGMVITIEPGLYIEEEQIGIRIEDNVLITEDGHENLSQSILKEPCEIERLMIR